MAARVHIMARAVERRIVHAQVLCPRGEHLDTGEARGELSEIQGAGNQRRACDASA
jgi:hypothetical protein